MRSRTGRALAVLALPWLLAASTTLAADPPGTPSPAASGTAAAAPGLPPPLPTLTVAPMDNATPERAVQLQPDGIETGSLGMDGAGTFAYYKFVYPGDRSTVTVHLQIEPDDAAVLHGTGFVLYGPNPGKEYVKGGAQPRLIPNVSGDLISSEAGTYVVQVYNYNLTTGVDFALTVSGLGPQPPSPVTVTPIPAAGAIPAASAGAAAPPGSPGPTASAVPGVAVTAASPAAAAGAPGAAVAAAPGAPSGAQAPAAGASGASAAAGAAQLAPAGPSAAGIVPTPPSAAPQAPAAPTPIAPPDQPIALRTPVRGQLQPSSSGSFATYLLTYPGDRQAYTINLQVSSDDPAILANVGFVAYGPLPGKEYARGGAQRGLRPNVSGDLIAYDGGAFQIQVYNYSPIPIDYELTVVAGAK